MRLPNDYDEHSQLTPSIISAVVAVTMFVAMILIVVLMMNAKQQPKQTSVSAKQESVEVESNSSLLTENVITGSTLKPEDLDFWDMYPVMDETKTVQPDKEVKKETEEKTTEGKPTEEKEDDPATDGKHTLIQYANGEEEWVLISPYLPKHEYDFTKLVCQSDIMKYYVDGKQVSYVGTDISKYQDYVDFVKLRKAGVDYCMLRVGARGYGSGQLVLDDYFSENIKRATDAGLEVGVYFFSQAITIEEAVEEANMVLEQIKDYKVSYPIAFNMEHITNDTARIDNLTKAEKTDITKAFLDTIQNAGYKPMIYADKEWLIKEIDMSKLTAYDVWLSQPGDLPDYPYQFTMWKYNEEASLDGIAGYANLDISFIDYSEK